MENVRSTKGDFALLHDTPDTYRWGLRLIGVDCDNKDDVTIAAPLPRTDAPFHDALYSSASLEKVVQITVYENNGSGRCAGIVLEYQSGGQRALGRPRVGLDLPVIYTDPTVLNIAQIWGEQPVAYLSAALSVTDRCDLDDGLRWICHHMGGTMEVWYTWDKLQIHMHHEESFEDGISDDGII